MSAKLNKLRLSYILSVKYVACITDSDGTDHQEDEPVYYDVEVIFELVGGHDVASDSASYHGQEQRPAHYSVRHEPWNHQTSVVL